MSQIFRRALVITLLGGTLVAALAGASTPPEERVVIDEWAGSRQFEGERLSVTLWVVRQGDTQLAVVQLGSADRVQMAALIPSSGEGLVTSTWGSNSRWPSNPVVLWSDGVCRDLHLRRTTAAPLVERAPWLVWGVRSADGPLLAALAAGVKRGWAPRELVDAFRGHFPDRALEVPEERELALVHLDRIEAPEALEAHWGEIAERFVSTRSFLASMDALTGGTTGSPAR